MSLYVLLDPLRMLRKNQDIFFRKQFAQYFTALHDQKIKETYNIQ